ncbi:MAG: ABC transporter permease [Flavobacteriales bacterium]
MDYYLQSLLLGLALAPMCWGIFITLRIFNFPDITTDGSYTLGAATTAVMLFLDQSPWLAMLCGTLSGMLSGIATGIINTRLKVNPLLAGILVMTALYSFNLFIMGRSNIPLLQKVSILNYPDGGPYQTNWAIFVFATIGFVVFAVILMLLHTDYGIAMRATGNNEKMVSAFGVNPQKLKIAGLAIANGMTALSGSLVAQLQGFADINMGIGIVIFGLGAAMIGERITQMINRQSLLWRMLGVLLGCLIFRGAIALAISSGIDPLWLKAITALFVLIFVAYPSKSSFKLKF